MSRVLSYLGRTPMAMPVEDLHRLASIGGRAADMTPEAIEALAGEPLNGTVSVTTRDGIAVVPVRGPLFRFANVFTRISGATSYELLARDLTAAVEDPAVRGVLLNASSPGGEVEGCSELADLISRLRARKPIETYVGGQGCSGMYWLASATGRITVADTAIIGSLGVAMTYLDDREAMAREGLREIEIVSSQSPKKRPDLAEDVGRAQAQALVNSLAGIFIAKVAEYRGVTVERVLQDFGQGGVFVGAEAVQAGMVDAVGSFEDVLAEMAERTGAEGRPPAGGGIITSNPERNMSVVQSALPAGGTPEAAAGGTGGAPQQTPQAAAEAFAAQNPQAADFLRTQGATRERERIQGIESASVPGAEEIITQMKGDPTKTSADAALAIIGAMRAGKLGQPAAPAPVTPPAPPVPGAEAHLDTLRSIEASVGQIGPGAVAGMDDLEAALAAEVAATVNA